MNSLRKLSHLITAFILYTCIAIAHAEQPDSCPKELDLTMRQLHSVKTINVCDFYKQGGPILIVNTASHCGFTKQFKELEALYQKQKGQGLVILGFPSNSFHQEEKSEEGTADVCYKNYGVTFPMFEPVEVKGDTAHPIFKYLSKRSEEPSWNFNKYLLLNGQVEHFGSRVAPDDAKLIQKISVGLKPAK